MDSTVTKARMLGKTKQTKKCRHASKGCTCYIPRDLFGPKGKKKIKKGSRAKGV
jgi:hypothetical protein